MNNLDPLCVTAIATAFMALATGVMAIATTVYAIISFKTLKQLRLSTDVATRPLLTLSEDTSCLSFRCPISVEVKNTGFGPAFEIQPEITGAPVGMAVDLNERSLAPGDTLSLTISARPIDFTETGSTPIYANEITNFSGVLGVLLSYKSIFSTVYTQQFNVVLDSDSRRVTLG